MKLYIDPGTGAMLFAMITGIIGIMGYFLKGLWVKIRFLLSGGKKVEENDDVIPFVIFSDDKRYWPVFEPVCRELDKRGFNVVYMTASPDDPALQNPYEHIHAEFIGEGNKAFVKLNFLKATMLLSTTPGLDVYQWKRSKDVKYYIHMPHMPGELTTYRMFGIDHYDALMLSGQYQIEDCRALEKLRNLPEKECAIVGIPYLDEKAKRLKTAAADPHERTVLVAPSWGINSLLNRFGNDLIDQLIATGYHIIIRPHPQSFISEKDLIDRLMKDYPQLEWNRDTDNFDVLNRSDILISDFSGVIFDYALVFDKPVICAYTDFDKSPYDAWWLNTPIWTATAIPRLGHILSEDNLNGIKEMIDSCLDDRSFAESREIVRRETWANCGESAMLAAEYLMGKYKALTIEPVNAVEAEAEVQPIEVEAELQESVENQNKPDTKSVIHEEPKHKKFASVIAVIATVAVAVGGAAFGLQFFFNQNLEKQRERSDLELMRMADAFGQIVLIRSEGEKQIYWLDAQKITLVTEEEEKPVGYGNGTSRVGGALKDYVDEDGNIPFAYDEKTDYTGKVLMVTIDPKNKTVSMMWVEGGTGENVSERVEASADEGSTD